MMKSALLAILSTLLVSCSPSRFEFPSRQAPKAEADLGWIVENLKPEVAYKLSHRFTHNEHIRISPIHQGRGIFEIYGVKQQDLLDLQYEYKDLKFHKNRFLYFENKPSSRPNATDDCPGGFVNSDGIFAPQTVPLGLPIIVEQKPGSSAAWNISVPLGSKLKPNFSASQQLTILPDMVGWYHFNILKSQSNGVCLRSTAAVLVTDNPPFDFTPPAQNFPFSLDLPWYLEELEATKLWQHSTGKDMVVAVLDSGINYRHRLLKNKIAINKKEIPGNDIDDDENGYVDDVMGYDFIFSDEFPFDEEGHGSHIAGLIVADGIGLAPDAKILPLKAVTDLRSDYGSLAAAIYYAVDAKVRILNISAGQTNEPLPEIVVKALKTAEDQGILILTSAGNGSDFGLGMNIDQTPVYPASLGLKNILVVTASDRQNSIAPYANFGVKTVQLVAPGGMHLSDPILSCYIENPSHIELYNETGTSMATALVSASTALLLSKKPALSTAELISTFLNSGVEVEELKPLIASGKKFRPLLLFP